MLCTAQLFKHFDFTIAVDFTMAMALRMSLNRSHASHCWSITNLEKGIDRGCPRAVHINLVHEEPLKALPTGKVLNFIIAAGLLVQKLITANTRTGFDTGAAKHHAYSCPIWSEGFMTASLNASLHDSKSQCKPLVRRKLRGVRLETVRLKRCQLWQ